MNTAAPIQKPGQISNPTKQSIVNSVGSMAKEQVAVSIDSAETVVPINSEVDIPNEVEQAGVKIQSEMVEIPPDVKKMGVTHAGSAVPVTATSASVVVLPLSDDQVVVGLHQPIISALRWLAEWSVRQLKKAHLAIKIVGGKLVRIPIR